MKTIGILSVMIMLLAVGVNAGFVVDKDAVVSGDWKWTGAWTYGNWQTASYSFDAISSEATSSGYTETERLGTPWKYSLDMNLGANRAGTTTSTFNAVTVNDPETTPATGGYTTYGFASVSTCDFGTSQVVITGDGEASVNVATIFDAPFTQINQVRVNE